ncbi:MAG: amidohydrolase [Lachnospiraceae bacterium]|nr:amidohydrolase [Candidatus Darwinimomas equi]
MKRIQIIATSDIHGMFFPYSLTTGKDFREGSMTFVSYLLKKHREENPDLIYLDCGDNAEGNLAELFVSGTRSLPTIDALNYMKCDVMTLGNHEFNFLPEDRDRMRKKFKGTMLCGNLFADGEDNSYLPGSTIIKRDGIKIGIIGMTTPMAGVFEAGKPTIKGFHLVNPLEVIRQEIDSLRKKKADCIIGLIHEGVNEENGIYGTGIRDIAAEFPEFDLIIGGHDHNPIECEREGDVLLCQPSAYARNIAIADLCFEETEKGYVLESKSLTQEVCYEEEDTELREHLSRYEKKARKFIEYPIGKLTGESLETAAKIKGISPFYTGSVPVANLVGEACMYCSGADCVALNFGNEYASLKNGDIRLKDVVGVYAYMTGTISVYELTGAQLKTFLEWTAAFYNTMQDNDLIPSFDEARAGYKYPTLFHVLGLCYDIDITRKPGSRVTNIRLINKNEYRNPEYNTDGTLSSSPVSDDSVIHFGTNPYYMRQWIAEGGCLEGLSPKVLYSSKELYADMGTVHMMVLYYIWTVMKKQLDGNLYQYKAWRILTNGNENTEKYRKAVELINAGKLRLYCNENGNTNIKSISADDVDAIERRRESVVQWRHWLHAHPELSTKEKETSAFIKKTLEDMGLEVRQCENSYGLTAVIEGTGEGKCLALRADFDALPVTEKTGLEFSSVNEGVMHACGHDMHTAILLGTAATLCFLRKEFKGRVKLIFQPAEEVSSIKGAAGMIEEGCLENPRVDAIIGEHMWPELEAGQIGIKKGVLTAATDRIVITVSGKAAHGGLCPQNGVDAVLIASSIVVALQSIASRNAGPFDNFVLSIGQISGGTAYNIVADQVVLTGTMRTVNENLRKTAKRRLERICHAIATSMGGSCRVDYNGSYEMIINDGNMCDTVIKAVEGMNGEAEAVRLKNPSMIGEDFSLYAQTVPACMYCFGTRMGDSDTSTLHQNTFAPSDELLEKGVDVMTEIAMKYLNERG